MSNVIVFSGSNSKNSINKQLAEHAASLLKSTNFEVLDLNDYTLPLFSVDKEKEDGFPENALSFDKKITESAGIIISLAEHNGSYTAAFKNLSDWLSRIEAKTWRNKPMLLMSTSPGARGGSGVLAAAEDRFPRHDSNITAKFSLPYFSENFSNNTITNDSLRSDLEEAVSKYEASLYLA